MQQTSDLYKELLAGPYSCETRLTIGESSSGADGGFDESVLFSIKTYSRMFSNDTPTVGSCVSGEIDVEMLQPVIDIPRKERLVPYVRLTDGTRHSEWIQKGVYFIDTRKTQKGSENWNRLILHGYDSMLRAEQDYPSSTLKWPATDIHVVREIAAFMGVSVDSRTDEIMTRGYAVQYPSGYSCREVLGYIAAMYAGCFIMSDLGELRLVQLNSIPPETRYLVDGSGNAITFGGVRILV